MTDAPPGAWTAGDDARRWLATMPGPVAGQRRLLESLITTAENEPAFRWLELGGSLARGAGDELSDIDAGLGVADDGWDEGLAAAAREWACLGWAALGDLAKYADRGSVWEARAKLEEARAHAWQLWAVAIGAVYPVFGLTAVLDVPDVTLPPGIGATAAGPGLPDVRRAADAVADLLELVTGRARSVLPFEPPDGLRAWARARLACPGPAGGGGS